MDPRLVHDEPQHQPGAEQDRRVRDLDAVEHRHRTDDSGGDEQESDIELVGVEHRDHNDRANVVDDRECQQEHLHGRRNAPAKEGDDTERKRDVGGHRDPPPTPTVTAGRERREDQCRHDHAAECGHGGQRGGLPITEVAGDQLTFDLQANDEEEECHEQVVDEMSERLLE